MGPIRRTYEFLRGRKRIYQQTFRNPAGLQVLADLSKFCRGGEPTFHPDARVHALLEGRREVYLRIMNHLNLTSEQLYALHTNHPLDPLLLEAEDKEKSNA